MAFADDLVETCSEYNVVSSKCLADASFALTSLTFIVEQLLSNVLLERQ